MPKTLKERAASQDPIYERVTGLMSPRKGKAGGAKSPVPEVHSPRAETSDSASAYAGRITPVRKSALTPSTPDTYGKQSPRPVLLPSGKVVSDTPRKIKLIEEMGMSPKKGAFGRDPAASVSIPARVDKVYKLIRKMTGTIGGNGTTGAIYGELTMGSMQKIVHLMMEKCGLSSDSRFIDVGSGLGKPNFHVAQYPGVRISIGIELESIRWKLAMHNMSHVLPKTSPEWTDLNSAVPGPVESLESIDLYGGVNFLCGDMDDAASTDPFTHIYMYDLGFPPPLQRAIAQKFNKSVHAEYLISYRPPRRVIDEYGYEVDFVDQCPTSMHGSGEIHTCYFYKRANKPPKVTAPPTGCCKIVIPGRPGTDDPKATIVFSANLFRDCIQKAVGDLDGLKEATKSAMDSFLTSGRPVRERHQTLRSNV